MSSTTSCLCSKGFKEITKEEEKKKKKKKIELSAAHSCGWVTSKTRTHLLFSTISRDVAAQVYRFVTSHEALKYREIRLSRRH